MRILILCKRRPMQRDLLEEPYGRFYHLSRHLAQKGHEVCLHLASYRTDDDFDLQRDGMRWIGTGWRRAGPAMYVRRSLALARSIRPDWIIGFSDTWYGILAVWLATRVQARSLIDAYDNYESYVPRAWPLHALWRRALRRADVLSAAGPGLAELMSSGRARHAAIVPMAADPEFRVLDRVKCRASLGLPEHAPLIGYCGSLHPNRGLEVLFEAYANVKQQVADAKLVLSGRVASGMQIPGDAISLGYLPAERVPEVLNAMNVLAVVNRDSAFGNHSYPVKLYEAMACGVPAVATATPASRWIMRDRHDRLCTPDDAAELTRRLVEQLCATGAPRQSVDSGWGPSAEIFEHLLYPGPIVAPARSLPQPDQRIKNQQVP